MSLPSKKSKSLHSKASANSLISRLGVNEGLNNVSEDQKVERVLRAKKKAAELQNKSNPNKAERKVAEFYNGPSVAMQAHHDAVRGTVASKSNNKGRDNRTLKKGSKFSNHRLFRKFLPMNLLVSKRFSKPHLNSPFTKKNFQDKLELQECLRKIALFKQLSNVTIDQLIDSMTLQKIPADQIVCKQGDFGDEMFVIRTGQVLVSKDYDDEGNLDMVTKVNGDGNGQNVRRLGTKSSASSMNTRLSLKSTKSVKSIKSIVEMHTLAAGDVFGELGLHYGSPRGRTCSTKTACEFWVLHRDAYRKIVENEYLRRNELMFEALKKIKILEKLHTEQLKELVQVVEIFSYKAGEVLIKKGSEAGTFYMIVSGKVNCLVPEVDASKDADQIKKTKSTESRTFIVDDDEDTEELDKLELDLEQGETDSQTGSRKDSKVSQKKVKEYSYGPGEYFGERGLYENDFIRKADVVALTDCEVLAISYKSLTESNFIGDLTKIFEENIRLQALEDAPFFDHLTKEESNQLQKCLETRIYHSDDYIIKEGELNSTFYIIRDGTVAITRALDKDRRHSFEIATLTENTFFGEGSVLSGKPAMASCVAKGDVTVYELKKQYFLKFVSAKKIQMIQEKFNERNRETSAITRSKKVEILSSLELKDFKPLANLGSGCFGLVKLVELSKDKSATASAGGSIAISNCYALKVLEKGTIVRNNQEINILNEKKILLECDHPFIVKLYTTFKDKTYLYFLMEFIQGGELFQFLHNERHGHLDSDTAKFFIACVVDALDYLHKKHIAYRDLKPENIMIDSDGYGKLVDFGFAKKLVFRTFTLCGTAQYLAPEILLNAGYTRSIDFWTVGILIYELFTGTTPFKRSKRDDLFHAIKYESKVKFHAKRWKGDGGEKAKDLVCRLLHKHPRKRLGCGVGIKPLKSEEAVVSEEVAKKTPVHDGLTTKVPTRGFKEVKEHEWFADIDFEKLYFKELPPPWKPTISGEKDTSHFEEYDDDESPLRGKYDDRAGDSERWKDF